MGMMKRYLEQLCWECGRDSLGKPNAFAQDAIEHAIMSGNIKLAYQFEKDKVRIMTGYDAIMDCWHKAVNQTEVGVAA